MSMPVRSLIKFVVVVIFAVVALSLAFVRLRGAAQGGEAGARVWFYDESAQRLYAAPADTIPPHPGVSGKRGDGVRAVVVRLPDGRERIAYLETCAPELKALLEEVRAAHAARRPFTGPVPTRDSDFFQTHTLVRRVDETTWHPANTPEALAIMAEWRAWGGPDGAMPAIATP